MYIHPMQNPHLVQGKTADFFAVLNSFSVKITKCQGCVRGVSGVKTRKNGCINLPSH